MIPFYPSAGTFTFSVAEDDQIVTEAVGGVTIPVIISRTGNIDRAASIGKPVLCICLLDNLSIYLSVCLSVCRCVCLSVFVSVCLSVCRYQFTCLFVGV